MRSIEENTYSVYLISNSINSKVYVGLTKGCVNSRLTRHKRDARNGSQCIIHRAIRKHCHSSFFIKVIFKGLSKHQAEVLEVCEIEKRNACGDGGYNILIGGGSGVSLRPDLTRNRKSLAAKMAWGVSEKWQNSIYCRDRLDKISRSSKLMHADPSYRSAFMSRHPEMVDLARSPASRAKAVASFKAGGNSVSVKCSNGMVFDMIADAARWVSKEVGKPCSTSNIHACANGKKKSAYGYGWQLDDISKG